MPAKSVPVNVRILQLYYAATFVFIVLDYFLNINIRLAAFEQAPGLRAGYYGLCLACLALMLWRPTWSRWIATGESLLTLSLLIIGMALRVTIVTDEMIESGRGAVTFSEILNFTIASSVAYIAYRRNWRSMRGDDT